MTTPNHRWLEGMLACRITCVDGGTVDVQGDLKAVVDELRKVFTRREHTFAVRNDLSGTPVAVLPQPRTR